MLHDLGDPTDDPMDDWLFGKRFSTKPKVLPVIARIKRNCEHGDVMPYWGTPPIVSRGSPGFAETVARLHG